MSERPTRQKKSQRVQEDGQQNSRSSIETTNQNMNTTEEKIDQIEIEIRRRKKKVLLTVLIVIFSLIVLSVGFYFLSTGLNDSRVVDLNNKVLMLESTIKSRDQKIQELNKAVADTTVKEVVPETSLQRVEGSEVPELWLIDGDFIAPNKLEIPTVKDDINNSNIQIGSRFKLKPSDNWLISMKGTTVEFSHPTKIWGKVRGLGHKERVKETEMKELIQKYFIGYPATTITYRKVFIDDMVVGYMGNADVTVKDTKDGSEREMNLNVGFAQRGDYTLSFLFVNENENVVAQELIDLLLTSTTFGDSKLKLE